VTPPDIGFLRDEPRPPSPLKPSMLKAEIKARNSSPSDMEPAPFKMNPDVKATTVTLLKTPQKSSSEIFRMRVMIVGPGEAGKTTLVERLLTNGFSSNQFSMTDGVSMKEWKLTPEVNLSLWDFGGQQVYLNTHSMLFSDKTLYLLVWNPRVGTDLRVLEEYLLNIRSRCQAAQIMLVTTHGSEVDEGEYQPLLEELKKHNYLCHHKLDSSTGMGVAELKERILKFVTEDYVEHSRSVVPGWYVSLEAKLKELSKSRFSVELEEFKSVCAELRPSPTASIAEEDEARLVQAVKTVLRLFHHWGVVFALKKFKSGSLNEDGDESCGDIILNPQCLADVFRCVITCQASTTGDESRKELFRQGILNHSLIESIWSGYEPRICSQFLRLLHESELCFEIFNSEGESTHRSLVPSLLPVAVGVRGNDEAEIREKLFHPSPPVPPSSMAPQFRHGYLKLEFDCLLPNFFPKLMVRLRFLSSPSPSQISRHHFIVHLAEGQGGEKEQKWSSVCVVRFQQSLFLYPGVGSGSSLSVMGVCNSVIRKLMEESFSGMCLKDLTLSINDEMLTKKKLLSYFNGNDRSPSITVDGVEILLAFLSPLLGELDPVQLSVSESSSSLKSLKGVSSPVDQESSSIEATLRDSLSRFETSQSVFDKVALGRALIASIPLLRQFGLGLSRSPSILWLVGRSSSSSQHYLYAVSPSVVPSLNWEIVPDSQIQFRPPKNTETDSSLCVDYPSQLLMRCLSHLLPCTLLPPHVSDWGLSLPVSKVNGARDEIFGEILQRESSLFTPSSDMFGEVILYSRELLKVQRGYSSLESGQLEKKMDHMISQLDRVEGSLNQLTQHLSGVFVEIRDELASKKNVAALESMKEVWMTRMDGLERAIRSSSENGDAVIARHLEELDAKITSKIYNLDMDVDPDRLSRELCRVRDELINANRGRLQGDQGSALKLDQILFEMRGLQSQLGRVEEKMTHFFGELNQSLRGIREELRSNGNDEGLMELREFWIVRMNELEMICRSNADASEAAIEKHMKKLSANIKDRLIDFGVPISHLTPQLNEMKRQLQSVLVGVREGNEQSATNFEVMMLEMKSLQTQFVEVIRLQSELTVNLNEVHYLFRFLSVLISLSLRVSVF
jgi:GTPase SAR1 family protein